MRDDVVGWNTWPKIREPVSHQPQGPELDTEAQNSGYSEPTRAHDQRNSADCLTSIA